MIPYAVLSATRSTTPLYPSHLLCLPNRLYPHRRTNSTRRRTSSVCVVAPPGLHRPHQHLSARLWLNLPPPRARAASLTPTPIPAPALTLGQPHSHRLLNPLSSLSTDAVAPTEAQQPEPPEKRPRPSDPCAVPHLCLSARRDLQAGICLARPPSPSPTASVAILRTVPHTASNTN